MTISVAILVFDNVIPFHLSVPFAVFEGARLADGAPAYELKVCALRTGVLRTSMGFSIVVEESLAWARRADMVIVPSWDSPSTPAEPELLEVLVETAARNGHVVGLCLGAFVLAAAGLLNGKSATTHWQWAGVFRKLYPQVSLDPAVLYVNTGNIVTSAGTSASIDCCLWLVRQQYGAEIANQVARQLVTAPFRDGGQAQYIQQPVCNTQSGGRFMSVLNWASENLAESLTIALLARRASLSRRSFTRRFQQMTGSNFREWLLSQRLTSAQRFLETTDQPVELVAQHCGFSSGLILRRYFRARFQTTPLAYRKAFRGEAQKIAHR